MPPRPTSCGAGPIKQNKMETIILQHDTLPEVTVSPQNPDEQPILTVGPVRKSRYVRVLLVDIQRKKRAMLFDQ